MDIQRRDFLLTGAMVTAAAAAAPVAAQTRAPASAPAEAVPSGNARSNIQAGDELIPYEGSKEVKRLKIINTAELEIEAEKILPKGGFDYIQSGSGAEYTKRENLRAMEAIGIEPHFLSGVLKPDLSVTIFGSKLPFPIIVPPRSEEPRVGKELNS